MFFKRSINGCMGVVYFVCIRHFFSIMNQHTAHKRFLDTLFLFLGSMFGGKKGKEYEGDDVEEYYDEEEDETYFDDDSGVSERGSASHNLLLDLIDRGNAFEVRAFIAGADADSVEMCVTRDNLSIKIDISDESEHESESYVYKELSYGTMERNILLTEEIDVDKVEANVENGVLVVTLPKFNTTRMREIEIRKK